MHRSSIGLWERETSLGGHIQGFMCTRSFGKAGTPWESGSDLPAGHGAGGLLEKQVFTVAHCQGRTLEVDIPGIITGVSSHGAFHFGKI